MWFKQAQIFKLSQANVINYSAKDLAQQLALTAFTPCLRSHPETYGWVPPIIAQTDEMEEPLLVHETNGNMIFCLQFEEKILPSAVVRQTLNEKIKEIELQEQRKVSAKHKYALKDEVTQSLLPKAFSKFSQVYGYIDTQHNWLVINTTNAKKTEKFIGLLTKSLSDVNIIPVKTVRIPSILTQWLTAQTYPDTFSVDKSCVLKDVKQSTRVIRCQQQDLSADPIQLIIKDGCEVDKLSLSWQDQLSFTLSNNLLLNNIKFQDELIEQSKDMEAETAQQKFNANFLIMSQTFSLLTKELLHLFEQK